MTGSPASSGSDFSNPNLSGFVQTSYVGAFAPGSDGYQWMAGWASFTPQSNVYIIGIQQISSEVPAKFTLEQNYPNPFNPTTNIKFTLPQAGFTTLQIYNMLGEEITTLVNQDLGIGTYKTDFNATNLSSGVYFYRITVKGSQGLEWTESKKMMLVK
jgi:hypothetical protein